MIGPALKLRASVLRALALLPALIGAILALRAEAGPPPGPIVGKIDGVSRDGEQAFLVGWACQQGQTKSISLHVFADHFGGDGGTEAFVKVGIANLDSEPAVGQACGDRNGKHRFVIALPPKLVGNGRLSKITVRGIRVVDGIANAAIPGSGLPLADLPAVAMQFPTLAAFRPLAGNYHSLAQHPRVFTTATELQELAARINRAGSYSRQRFGQLAAQVQRDLASPAAWSATYSGYNIGIYLYAFSYEPQDGNAAEAVRSALQLGADSQAPAGAAVVASRLSLYAALVKAGAVLPPDAPSPVQAAALAKRILLAWGEHGLRDGHGHFRRYSDFCEGDGKPTNPALQLSRGIIYSVHAQDLLGYLGVIDDAESKTLDTFHAAIYDLIRRAANDGLGTARPACEYYTNGGANVLASLLAIARLLDDERKFEAVVRGVDRDTPVWLPWTVFIDHAIYGEGDSPLECYANSGPDGLTSRPGYVTPHVAAGEVQDRYRNANPLQGMGYAMFTLERLIDAAEIQRIAGFDPYGYRGRREQSIEMALAYYACFAKDAGFGKIVTAENSTSCPNAAQYYGKVVNGVDRNELVGTYRLPNNRAIAAVVAAAKIASVSGPFALDTILFGKWPD